MSPVKRLKSRKVFDFRNSWKRIAYAILAVVALIWPAARYYSTPPPPDLLGLLQLRQQQQQQQQKQQPQAYSGYQSSEDSVRQIKSILNCNAYDDCSHKFATIFQQQGQIISDNPKAFPDTNDHSDRVQQNFATHLQQPRRGILLTSQCSGSEWLSIKLNETPGIVWHAESLRNYSSQYRRWASVSWNIFQRDLERAFPKMNQNEDTTTAPTYLFGFKLMYDQIPQRLYGQFANWAVSNNIHILHLRRRCAALQFASQLQKVQRLVQVKHKGWDVNHFTNQTLLEALTPVQKITLEDEKYSRIIGSLEQNQIHFARYLRVNLARAPVFEINYEDLDGPFQTQWFRAILSFLGVSAPLSRLDEEKMMTTRKMIKTGSRLCEDRMDHLGGLEYRSLADRVSRYECLRLRELFVPDWDHQMNKNEGVAIPKGIGTIIRQSTFPPNVGQCFLRPSCRQWEYMRQYKLLPENYTI